MNCERFNDKLASYLEGSIESEMESAMKKHRDSCTDCAKAYYREKNRLAGVTRNDLKEIFKTPESFQREMLEMEKKEMGVGAVKPNLLKSAVDSAVEGFKELFKPLPEPTLATLHSKSQDEKKSEDTPDENDAGHNDEETEKKI